MGDNRISMVISMTEKLTQLGEKVPLPSSPAAAVIETVPWDHPYSIVCRFDVPEWTGICPVTGQPDFGHIFIDYIPKGKLIESKSLKLFMGSFRNHGCFHEKVIDLICARLYEAADPAWIRVAGVFNARGGIGINAVRIKGCVPYSLNMSVPCLPF